MCSAVGPCTPSVMICSMSPDRLGPGDEHEVARKPPGCAERAQHRARRGHEPCSQGARRDAQAARGSPCARRRQRTPARPCPSSPARMVALVTPRSARAAASIDSGSTSTASARSSSATAAASGSAEITARLHRIPLDELGDELGRHPVAVDAVHLGAHRLRGSLERTGEVVGIEEMRLAPRARSPACGGIGCAGFGGAGVASRRLTRARNTRWSIRSLRRASARGRSRCAGIGASRPAVHRERPGARSANRPRPAARARHLHRRPERLRVRPRRGPRPPRGALGNAGRVRRPAPPEREQQVLQRDAHRAGVHARAAQRRRVGELGRLLVLASASSGREHRADRAAVHPAVGVAADLAVHGAHVQARAAADARQDLLQLGAEDVAAAVVEDHDVQLVGPVGLALAARAR